MSHRVPDFTTKDGGLCRCTALRITRKEGAPEYLVDLSLTFALDLEGNETADVITLPPLLEHPALLQVLD